MVESITSRSSGSMHHRTDMGIVGYVIAAAAAFILLPVLPILVPVFLVHYWYQKETRGVRGDIDYETSAAEPPEDPAAVGRRRRQ